MLFQIITFVINILLIIIQTVILFHKISALIGHIFSLRNPANSTPTINENININIPPSNTKSEAPIFYNQGQPIESEPRPLIAKNPFKRSPNFSSNQQSVSPKFNKNKKVIFNQNSFPKSILRKTPHTSSTSKNNVREDSASTTNHLVSTKSHLHHNNGNYDF